MRIYRAHSKIRWLSAALLLLFIVFVRWWELDREVADWFSKNRQWDKLGHCLLYAGIFCVLVALSARHSTNSRLRSWIGAGLIAFGLGVLDELIEAWKSAAAFEWADLGADLIGAWVFGPLLTFGLLSLLARSDDSHLRSQSESENRDPARVARIDAIHGRRHHRRRVPRR